MYIDHKCSSGKEMLNVFFWHVLIPEGFYMVLDFLLSRKLVLDKLRSIT